MSDNNKKNSGAEPLQPLRVGIISNETNREDLLHYKDELIKINNELKGRVELVVFGFDGVEGKDNWLKGVDFEFVKPTSIIHYFKQLNSLNIDVLFIPLVKSIFNATSENYNKYLEAAIFEIPVLTLSIYPYNSLIQDKRNGFLFKEKNELITYIDHLYTQRSLVRTVALQAKGIVEQHYNYSAKNINVIEELFQKDNEL